MSSVLLQQPQLTHEYLARVALDASHTHLAQLQQAVDTLAEQARTETSLTPVELEFLTALLDNPWWGGKDLGYNYAQQHFGQDQQKPLADIKQPYWAQLQNYFVAGSGQHFAANRQYFQASRLVQDVVSALKQFIKKQHQQNRAIHLISTRNSEFLMSSEALKLEENRRSNETLGYIFNDGTLLLEQKDPRLNRVFDRFIINAYTTPNGSQYMTRWRIEGLYSFAFLAQSEGKTGLVLTDNLVLTVPFRLGQVLAEQGGARSFDYFVDWMEWYS